MLSLITYHAVDQPIEFRRKHRIHVHHRHQHHCCPLANVGNQKIKMLTYFLMNQNRRALVLASRQKWPSGCRHGSGFLNSFDKFIIKIIENAFKKLIIFSSFHLSSDFFVRTKNVNII
jgi:hypothetical protein